METVTLVGGCRYVQLLYNAGFITQSQAISASVLRLLHWGYDEFTPVELTIPRDQYEKIRAVFPKIDDKFTVKN